MPTESFYQWLNGMPEILHSEQEKENQFFRNQGFNPRVKIQSFAFLIIYIDKDSMVKAFRSKPIFLVSNDSENMPNFSGECHTLLHSFSKSRCYVHFDFISRCFQCAWPHLTSFLRQIECFKLPKDYIGFNI